MNINKAQLKKLIEAVIREAEDVEDTEKKKYPSGHGPIEKDPSKLAYPKGQFPPIQKKSEPEGESDPNMMKYSRELENRLKAMKGTKIELYVKHGVRKGKQEFRDLLKKMAQEARQKDFEVIMGQVKKGDKVVDIAAAKNLTGTALPAAGEIDPEDEKAAKVAAYQSAGMNVKGAPPADKPEGKPEPTGRMTIGKMIDIINELPDEEKKLEFFDKLTKSERKAVMNKLAGMGEEGGKTRMMLTRVLPLDPMGPRPGQEKTAAAAWNKMSDDEKAEKSRLAKERNKIEAEKQAEWGLSDEKFALIDPITYLPDEYWIDKEWDRFTQGGEVQTATAGAGTKHAGKSVYRPSFSAKKVNPELLKKLAIGTLREVKKRVK